MRDERKSLAGDSVYCVLLQLYSDLLTGDQLVLEQSAGNVFQGFREGAITFPPTYKYDLFRYGAHVSGVQCSSLFLVAVMITTRPRSAACPPTPTACSSRAARPRARCPRTGPPGTS